MSTETVDPAMDTDSGDDAFERAAAEEGIDLGGTKPVETEPEVPAAAAETPTDTPAPTGDAPAASAPAETPAPAQPWKWRGKLKLDGQEVDAEADEPEVVSALQIARKIDDIRAREALNGARYVVDALKSQGVNAELWLNPETRLYEARVVKPVTTPDATKPATETPSKPASETIDVDALEKEAADGDWNAAIQLLKVDREERKRLIDTINEQRRAAEEAAKHTSEAATAARIEAEVTALQTQYAKVFEGPHGKRAWDYAMAAARREASLPTSTVESVMSVLRTAAELRAQERGELLRQVVPSAQKAPTPPPVVGGTSAPPPARQDSGPPSPRDPNYDEKLAKWLAE